MDAVLLSGFAKVRRGETAIDLGTGTGILPILLEAKTEGARFTGLEIQPESADMARRSVRHNHLEGKIDIVVGDIKDASKRFGASSFHVVTSNPPYLEKGAGLLNPNDALAVARHEILCTLEDVIREGARLLRQKGRFYLVHRPFRLVDIFVLMRKYGVEPKRVRMVHPFLDKEPILVLVEGVLGGNPRLAVGKPLVIYEEPGVFTDEINEIYGY